MHSVLLYLLPWEVSPTVILVCAASAVLYTRGLVTLHRRGERVGFWQPFSFFVGLVLDYVVLQTYYDFLAQHMFWVHRLQHLVLHHVAPVLLVLASPGRVMWVGIPSGWRQRAGAARRGRARTARRTPRTRE